jgi:hypothetical protein
MPAIFAAAVLLLSSSANAAVQVVTDSGSIVRVDETEIRRVYTDLILNKSKNAREFFLNDDGSVSMMEPKFKWQGNDVSLLAPSYGDDGSICKIFGLGRPQTFTRRKAQAGESWVQLEHERVSGTELTDTGHYDRYVFTSLTCSP